MKKLMKENKILFVLALIIIICVVLIVFGLVKYFYGGKDPYGDRLNGKDKLPISENISKDIKSLYQDEVSEVSVDVKGKIIYIIMDVKNGTTKENAESLANKALEKFSEEEKNYYDIQFLVTCNKEEAEDKLYPIEGYKNSSNNQIIWTNN